MKFKLRDRVRHETFGDGEIVWIAEGLYLPYTVKFDNQHISLHSGQRGGNPSFGVYCCWFCDEYQITLIPESSPSLTTSSLDRTMIAAMCLQGMLSATDPRSVRRPSSEMAATAAEYADALIAELSKPKP